MKRMSSWSVCGITLSAALFGAAGCMGEGDLEIVDDELVGDQATADESQLAPGAAEANLVDYYLDDVSITVGEKSATAPEEAGASALAGCVRVEYCQHPDPVLGTTCIWDACSFNAAWAECDVDGRFVCGRINPVKGMRLP